MKRLIIISFLLLAPLLAFCQAKPITKDNLNRSSNSTFYLRYSFSGLGSNMGSFQPTIRIKETNFLYTFEQNSYYGEKNNRVDTICVGAFRQSSIDSIIDIIRDLKDTSINEYNFCVMSGGIHFLTLTDGIDTTNFRLSNTFHYTALKIANILNEYVPADKQLWVNEQMIKDAEECLEDLLEGSDKDKRRTKKSGT